MDEDQKAHVLETVSRMLDNDTCKVLFARGIHHYPDAARQWMLAKPTNGETLTIEIHGGAQETRE